MATLAEITTQYAQVNTGGMNQSFEGGFKAKADIERELVKRAAEAVRTQDPNPLLFEAIKDRSIPAVDLLCRACTEAGLPGKLDVANAKTQIGIIRNGGGGVNRMVVEGGNALPDVDGRIKDDMTRILKLLEPVEIAAHKAKNRTAAGVVNKLGGQSPY